jgi:hypothetical protein
MKRLVFPGIISLPLVLSILLCGSNFASAAAKGNADQDQPANRTTSLGSEFSAGSKSYSLIGMDGTLGLNPIWQIAGSFASISSEGDKYNNWYLGPSASALDAIELSLHFESKKNAGQARGTGFELGFNGLLSALWQGDLQTMLTLTLERLRYASATPKFNETGFTLGLRQDINESWLAHVGYGRENYSRPAFATGYPRGTINGGITWNNGKEWEIDASISRDKSLYQTPNTTTYSLEPTYNFSEKWAGSLTYALTTEKGAPAQHQGTLRAQYTF